MSKQREYNLLFNQALRDWSIAFKDVLIERGYTRLMDDYDHAMVDGEREEDVYERLSVAGVQPGVQTTPGEALPTGHIVIEREQEVDVTPRFDFEVEFNRSNFVDRFGVGDERKGPKYGF